MSEVLSQPLERECPFVGLRPFRQADSHLFFGRDTDLLAAAHALGSIASNQIFVVTGSPGCGKSSFVQAALLPHLLTSGCTTHASVDLSAAHDLRTFCARCLLRSTSQAGSTRLASRLADLMIVDPAAAAEFFRDFLRAELPASAPPTPVVVEHLERLLSRDEADLLTGGIPAQSRAGRNLLATLVELARLPEVIVLGTARSFHFQKITDLAPDGISLFEFPISPITSRSAIADILHLTHPLASLESTKKLRESAVGLVSRFPSILPFVTSLLARLQLSGCDSPKETGASSADRLLLEVMADHADAAITSLRKGADSGFNPLFRLLFPDAVNPPRHRAGDQVSRPRFPVEIPLTEIGTEWEIRRAAMALIDCGILTIREREFEGAYLEACFPPFLSRWRFAAAWISQARSYAHVAQDVEKCARQWEESARRRCDLLAPGTLLDLAARIVAEDRDRLSESAITFIQTSLVQRKTAEDLPMENRRTLRANPITATLASLLIIAGLWISQSKILPVRHPIPSFPPSVAQIDPDFDILESALQPVSFTRAFEPSADDTAGSAHQSAPEISHPHLPLPLASGGISATDFLLSDVATSPDQDKVNLSPQLADPITQDTCDPLP